MHARGLAHLRHIWRQDPFRLGASEKIKQKLCSFLNMVEIEPADPSFGTLAGMSSTGVQIRALVKVRTEDVKIDIKSGNVALGKAISSELKKLII